MSIEISSFFAHPFVLLIAGVLISSVFITLLTQNWQNKRRQFEIKISLINDIAEAIILINSELNSRLAGKIDIEKQVSVIIKLKKIEANLYAYFPKDKLSEEWKEYTDYTLLIWSDPITNKSENEQEKFKKTLEKQVQPYFTKILPNINVSWDKIIKNNDQKELDVVRSIMLTYYPYFVKKVTNSSVTIF